MCVTLVNKLNLPCSPLNPYLMRACLSPPHAATRKRMEPLLRDPKVQSALSDPRVKQIMQVLKADPEKAQRYVKMFPHGVYKHISM